MIFKPSSFHSMSVDDIEQLAIEKRIRECDFRQQAVLIQAAIDHRKAELKADAWGIPSLKNDTLRNKEYKITCGMDEGLINLTEALHLSEMQATEAQAIYLCCERYLTIHLPNK